MPPVVEFPPVVTKSRLIADLGRLGLRPGHTVMLHASVKSLGRVVGGPDTVIESILEVLGHQGTLMMMVSWEDSPYELRDWPREWREAYKAELPAFDPERSRAYRKWSILTEYLRTWPGAKRSSHPDVSFAAVGRLADSLTANHPLSYPLGPGSPLEKLVEAGGQVLLLGVDFGSLTLIHYAEHLADVDPKPAYRYEAPVLVDGQKVWVQIVGLDSNMPIGTWPDQGYFQAIARGYLASGQGTTGRVGAADAYYFDARTLVTFAVEVLERRRYTLETAAGSLPPTSTDDNLRMVGEANEEGSASIVEKMRRGDS